MSLGKDFDSLVGNLSDDQLADLREHVNVATESRRRRVDLNDIKPGMTAEDKARVRAEISRALQS
jgi:hypothetical protein